MKSFAVRLKTDSERANTAGLTAYDVAMASQSAMSGHQVTSLLREGDKQIPVVAVRMEERAQLGDLKNLCCRLRIMKIHLGRVIAWLDGMQTEKMRARNQFRTITVSAMPTEGKLPSEVMTAARRS